MPTPPSPSQPPSDPEWPGTQLETDDDIRRALQVNQSSEPPAAKAAPPTPRASKQPPQRSSASPFRPTQRAPIALLTVLDDGKSEGEVVRLRSDRFLIGRSEGDFLLPHDHQISARHLEITRHSVGETYRWVLTDLQSSNGLFIRVSRTALGDKAEFLVGMGRYRFEAPGGGFPETGDALPSGSPPSSTRIPGLDVATLQQPAIVELVGGKVLSRLPLVKPEYWIGSDSACAIYRAEDPFLEPRHARLYREASGAWHAQNNKSPNGLWVKMPQITVTDSCSFQIGEQRFRLSVGG